MTSSITVHGMTCGHCASSVREELAEIPGVRVIDVDIATGTVVIDSDGPVEESLIREAVEEAGYRLAAR